MKKNPKLCQEEKTCSHEEKRECRSAAMKSVVSSRESATKLLKSAGILSSDGKIAKHYR